MLIIHLFFVLSSMLSIRKILLSKGNSSLEKQGRNGKDNTNSSRVRTVINEEYKEAFRTKSYTKICDIIQGQLETRISVDDANSLSSPSSSTMSSSQPSPSPEHIHLSEYLAEPCHETLVSKHHHFLTNYFQASLEAGRVCEFILQKIHQVRVDYHAIRSVIEVIERKPDLKTWSHNQHDLLHKNLVAFALHSNPFASMTPQRFHELHETHQHFLHQLTSKCAKMKSRQKKLTRFIKRALAITGCGALTVALSLLVVHSMVGVVATPVLMIVSCLAIFMMKKLKRKKQELGRKQLDAAAKGIYILINYFDTMSRLVQRLHDEMEHKKFAAGVCVRKGNKEVFKDVVREFQMHEFGFLEQLEELEKHICLCFLDINRSRRLLIQELDK